MSQQLHQQQQHRHNRIALAITAYFGSATASLAWILHRSRPARDGWSLSWSSIVQDAASLWNPVPNEVALLVFINFFVSALAMASVLTAALFLGRLSVTESQRLSRRLIKYTVLKTVLVGSVITTDPRDVAVWLAWFAVVGYIRLFLGAAKDRLEALLSSPGAQLSRHTRGVCLLVMMLMCNAVAFALVLRVLSDQSLARLLLCAFDSTVIAIEGLKTLLRYVVNMADRYHSLGGGGGGGAHFPPSSATTADTVVGGGGGRDVGWPGKGSFLYHAELVADVLVHAMTLAHYLHVWVLHGLSLRLVDAMLFLDMRTVLISLLRRLRSHLSYRAATQRLNTTFRDVHPAALAAAGGGGGGAAADCTICMDEIVHVAKQLPCGHVFHLSCLRAWLQQSGSESFTCPNCRQPILVGEPGVGGSSGDSRGDGGGGGDRRRRRFESDWWIVRMWDRLYLRLVVALEPLLLTLLISITLWLGGRTQVRRRAARAPPSPSREGSGESPWPPPAAAVVAEPSGRSGGTAGRRRSRRAGGPSSDLDRAQEMEDDAYGNLYNYDELEAGTAEEDEEEEEEEVYGENGDGRDRAGGTSNEGEEGEEAEHGLWRGSDGSDSRDADSDVGAGREDAAAWQRDWQQAVEAHEAEQDGDGEGWQRGGVGSGWRGTARHICAALEAGRRCGTAHGPHTGDGAGPSHAAAAPHSHPLGRASRHWRTSAYDLGPDGDGAMGRGEEQAGGSQAFQRRWARGGGVSGGGGGGGRGEPSAAAAGARRRGVLRGPPFSAEVPSYSGDVLVPHAMAVVQQIGRTISASLRSTLTADGACAGAVAWVGSDEEDGEEVVSSRRRRPRTRAARRGGAALLGCGGDGGGTAPPGGGQQAVSTRSGGGAAAAAAAAGALAQGGEPRRRARRWLPSWR